MSFDFEGDNNNAAASDPTSDFVSKFPSLDGEDADNALTSATSGTAAAGTTGIPPALDDFENDLLGGGGGNAAASSRQTTAQDEDEDDFLGGGSSAAAAPAKPRDERDEFESNFPELDDPDLNGSGGGFQDQTEVVPPPSSNNLYGSSTTQNGFGNQPSTQISGRGPNPSGPTGTQATFVTDDHSDDEEPEPVRQWRHRQGDEIARRDATSERKKGEIISQAERDIDQFYAEYNAKKEKSIKKNKEDEATFLSDQSKTLAEGTTWDRITKLIELQNSQSKTIAVGGSGATDLSRMRELLLSLRREGETAPAAGGY